MNLSSSEEMETWYDKYNYFMVDLRDPRYVLSLYTAHHYTIAFNIFCVYSNILSRTDNYFMMSSVWPTVAICILYVFICKVVGPW